MSHFPKLFKNSTWIVPRDTLKAYLIGGGSVKSVRDQTVWIIDSYSDGYIFGTAYLSIDGVPFSQTKIIGSITPCLDVALSFYNDTTITSGSGKFMRDNGKWKFLMQMNTLSNSQTNNSTSTETSTGGISHWKFR